MTLDQFDPQKLTRASAILQGMAVAYFDVRRRHSIDPRNRVRVKQDQEDMQHLLDFVSVNVREIYG